MEADAKKAWEEYRRAELARIAPLLEELGFALDEEQVHLSGERYLLSGRKLVLTGVRKEDGRKCIIKASSDSAGRKEIEHEHICRRVLHSLSFAYLPFFSPTELAYRDQGGLTLCITAYIEESRGFLERALPEQFALALDAFRMQEGVQATTYAHARTIRDIFGIADAGDYLDSFAGFSRRITSGDPDPKLEALLAESTKFLEENRIDIERYSGFLTHTDFVPHNLRIWGDHIYLLDQTSLRFGNKYESWARFINYMELYNPELAKPLIEYVRLNRAPEEYRALRLMRVYKLGFLLAFYADNLAKTSGDLRALSERRIAFWAEVLKSVLADMPVAPSTIEAYRAERDALRTEEEKVRQRLLKQL